MLFLFQIDVTTFKFELSIIIQYSSKLESVLSIYNCLVKYSRVFFMS